MVGLLARSMNAPVATLRSSCLAPTQRAATVVHYLEGFLITATANASETDEASSASVLPVSRVQVVQAALDLFTAPTYLEVGVNQGKTFNALGAETKVAVDPRFLFDYKEIAATVPGTSFHEITSDEYFGTIATRETQFDVIYLDGLHTAEQTVRDLINAITLLSPQGVIVIDDVFPNSYAASLPDRGDTRRVRKATGDTAGAWMGDVFRLVYFVETFCQQFSYATVSNNHGQLVMWRQAREEVPARLIETVARKEYKDVLLEQDTFRLMPLSAIVAQIEASRA